jgi:hypothetical protein
MNICFGALAGREALINWSEKPGPNHSAKTGHLNKTQVGYD